MDFLQRVKEFFSKIKERWDSLSPGQKALIGGGIAAVLVAVFFAVFFFLKPVYVLLVSGLTDEEAGMVTSKLEELNIPYKVGPGNRIYIPAKYNVYEVRMKLAAEGVLGRATKGFELVEETGLGATSFDKQVRYQIALQGELERSIMTIKGVKFARVHLVLPKYTYYVRGEMTEPRASVLVVLEPGADLTNQQIKGIMELVAGAVEGLKLENVKVIDQYSRVLSDRVLADLETVTASSKLELKMNLESYYRKKLKDTLEKVFGPGRVEVIPDIRLNWTEIEKESKIYTPPTKKGGLVRSQQSEEEKAQNMPAPPGGPVGTDSNVPPLSYKYVTGEGTSTYERKSSTVNYELNEMFEKVVQNRQGEIESLTVSVIIDSSSMVLSGVGDLKSWVKKVTDLVEKGVGASASPSNLKVAVTFLPFDRTLELEYRKSLEEIEKRTRYRFFATGIILLTALTFLIIYLLSLQIRKARARKILEERRVMLEKELQKVLKVEEEVPPEELTEEQKELQELTERLDKAFGKDPADIAYVIKLWIGSSS